MEIKRCGSLPSQKGRSENFIGSVRVDFLFMPNQSERTRGAYVTFEPVYEEDYDFQPVL